MWGAGGSDCYSGARPFVCRYTQKLLTCTCTFYNHQLKVRLPFVLIQHPIVDNSGKVLSPPLAYREITASRQHGELYLKVL